jgi:hypothetical protein
MTTDDEATAPSAKVARGSNAYLAQEILWTLREFRPAGEAWPTELLEPNEKNTFLKEFNRACTTLELSCQSRQHDEDRGAPPVLDSDGEIAKFDTLRFLACHLPRDPLASVFKVPKDEEGKVNKNQAEEMHEKKKTFFEVWERLHQLIAHAWLAVEQVNRGAFAGGYHHLLLFEGDPAQRPGEPDSKQAEQSITAIAQPQRQQAFAQIVLGPPGSLGPQPRQPMGPQLVAETAPGRDHGAPGALAGAGVVIGEQV